ncbi:FAD-dependent oxidoreductase [Microbacterium testaceum]|nr:GMC oxidoreductase [Microbacterium testaceum]MCC4250594.1 FAD-dependent oxidoreductase [Microbacterium testaceum]
MCQTASQPRQFTAADPRSDASPMVDAIVIGSGFGGAVAAARLAQAGRSVLVLERGRRFSPADFPRGDQLSDGWLWNAGHGIYDIRWLDRMLSIQAAGWGGGSLVYANVFARPAAEVFADPRWDESRAPLDPYYDLAAHMLEVSPVTADPATGDIPGRVTALEGLAARIGRPRGTIRPNLAVRFTDDPEATVTNRYGVSQRGCSFCGECVVGCTRGAKNSLDLTYLALAERHGARGVTGAEVDRIEPLDDGYLVSWCEHGTGQRRQRSARLVIVAAGAVGTTELLLRQRDVLRTLPRLSPRLGEGFSGNGDALTFLSRPQRDRGEQRGPTITTTTILDVEEDGSPVWFQVQDGAVPEPLTTLLSNVIREALPGGTRHHRTAARRRRDTLALLLMGRDSATGRLTLDRRHEATVAWDAKANRRLTRAQSRVGKVVRQHLGGRAYASPIWSLLRTPITVHPLGGAPRSDHAQDGVIDRYGNVHGYPGLVILDGAAVPAATGSNPSATILALAERSIEHTIRTTGTPDWRAPEWDEVRPTPAPEDEAFAAMAQLRIRHAGDGLRFRERLTGTVQLGQQVQATLHLAAEIPSWDRFRASSRHPLTITGTLDIAGVATHQPVRGRLELFPDGEDKAMRYVLDSQGDDDLPIRLVGHKAAPTLHSAWRPLTTLHLELDLSRATDREARIALGTARISVIDVLRLLRSVEGMAFTGSRRRRVARRFVAFFALRTLGKVTTGCRRRPPSRPAHDGRRLDEEHTRRGILGDRVHESVAVRAQGARRPVDSASARATTAAATLS